MSHEVFTDPWAKAWADELRDSEAYRDAARSWEGSILLEMTGKTESMGIASRAVFVDLWHGDCRAARHAGETEQRQADYVIRGDIEVWKRILSGELEPIFALMSGKLQLVRGSLAKLTPYLAASRELVLAAARVDSSFPEG